MPRTFSPYELNHLKKYGYAVTNLESFGEEPVEYITGHAQFKDLDFLVNPSTLIPRIESETIVDLALQFISQKNLPHPVIADIGTGSGCLGITIAVNLSKRQVPYTIYLSDISQDALNIAGQNADHLLPSRVNLFFQQSSLMDSYPQIQFDIIIANLPYIPSSNINLLDSSVKDFEPHTALDGGPLGTTLINQLLSQIPQYLSPAGIAIFEVDDSHRIEDFSVPNGFSIKTEKDLNGIPRFLVITLKQ